MRGFEDIWSSLRMATSYFPSFRAKDFIEIFIIAYVLYKVLLWFRGKQAWTVFKGILILIGSALIAYIMEFNTILWIFANTINVGIIAVFIMFQPELRSALEQLGKSNFARNFLLFADGRESNGRITEENINQILQATEVMSKAKTGALIVMEREVDLSDYIKTGIMLNANISKELLLNIFEHNVPLHDGAVIIRGQQIVAATCYLPLSDNMSISKELGTRHRAGVGISEQSDAIVIIVSEETGKISIVVGGNLVRAVDSQYLKNKLINLLGKKEPVKRHFLWKGFGKSDKESNR